MTLYSSAFCGACAQTRVVLDEVARVVPAAHVVEYDVVAHEERPESLGIRSTPTVLVARDSGEVVFRAEGAPTTSQMLQALTLAL